MLPTKSKQSYSSMKKECYKHFIRNTQQHEEHFKTIIGQCPGSRDKMLTLVGLCLSKKLSLHFNSHFSDIVLIFEKSYI